LPFIKTGQNICLPTLKATGGEDLLLSRLYGRLCMVPLARSRTHQSFAEAKESRAAPPVGNFLKTKITLP